MHSIRCAGIRLVAALVAVPAAAAQDRVFFGNLHSHTSYSDGSGTPHEAFHRARYAAGLHFLAITEHNHRRADGSGPRRDGLLIATNATLYAGPQAAALIPTARRFTEDGRFVALYGQEFSTIDSGNHTNVFEVDDVIDAANGDFAGLVRWLEARRDQDGHTAIVQLNHPADFHDPATEYGADDFGSTAGWVTTMGAHAALIELLIGPALQPTDGHRPRVMQADYLHYLNLGFRLAPTGNQDNHFFTWGTITEARTAVIAPALTRAALLAALRARRVYATEDRNLELIARVNGEHIGSVISALPPAGSDLAITLAIHDPDEPDAAYRVEVFVDDGPGGPPAAVAERFMLSGDSPAGQPYRLEGIRFQGAGQYVFLKVTQSDEHGDEDRAWTAPVWFGTPGPAAASGGMRIVSLLPNPPGDERQAEEIVLRNTGSTTVNLGGWVLRDAAGLTWSLASAGTLAPGAQRTIRRSGQAMSLNNDGDTIVLVNADGDIVQSVSYPAMAEGQRFTP
jgi:hypothetical protein